jgi:hypothetical protein
MQSDKMMIKDDNNFLENPNWVLSEKGKVYELKLEKEKGCYEIKCMEGLPNRFDKIVLYYLHHLLFSTNFSSLELVTTRYMLAKNCLSQNAKTNTISKGNYDRIMRALDKWKSIVIKFEGIFYEGDNYTYRMFSVLDDVILDKQTLQLYIKFNQQYVKQLQETKFYKLINFQEYKILTRPVSGRLYEILIKSFKERAIWPIKIQNLAEKLTLEKRAQAKNYYPTDVLAKLKPAIEEINSKTALKVSMRYDAVGQLCMFKQESPLVNDGDQKGVHPLAHAVQLLVQHGVPPIRSQQLAALYSIDQIKHKIEVLKHGGHVIKNVGAWLTRALAENWSSEKYEQKIAAKKAKEEKLKQQQDEDARKKQQEALKIEQENSRKAKALEIFNALPVSVQGYFNQQFALWLSTYGTGRLSLEDCKAAFLAKAILEQTL